MRARVFGAVWGWAKLLVPAIAVALLARAYVIEAYTIPSVSMEPTLQVGDRVLAYKLGYGPEDISPGDIVIFRKPEATMDLSGIDHLVKRVVAVAGETVEFRDGQLHVDGSPLDEPYVPTGNATVPLALIRGCANPAAPDFCRVPEGTIFVLGDNRSQSRDSRWFGPVDADSVVARTVARYWPPSRVGGID